MHARSTHLTEDRPHETDAAPAARGHVGRIVTLTILVGLVTAVVAVAGPFAGAQEHIIAGLVLAVFALSWALLAFLTTRWTDQPQRWAAAPATVMGAAAATILVLAPTGNQLGWVWPPAMVVLVAWMVIRSRRALRSRARTMVLYPVFAALALSGAGGIYQTYRQSTNTSTDAMPGRLIEVGGHKLHLDCRGSGGPTVVLEPGLGETSVMMAGWVAPAVAETTRVCVYDRAGRGWSESAAAPQDGTTVATDLHTLLARAGEPGPYVLAGHSAGGIYVLNFARLFPQDVAGVVLLDSMYPQQYTRMASWPGFYTMFKRASAVMTPLSRLGVNRLINSALFNDLPPLQRDQQREFLSTPRHNRSVRDEFSTIRTAMDQAATLDTVGDLPLIVLTAQRGAEADWLAMQADLATLSTNVAQRELPDAEHAMVVEDPQTARISGQAIVDIVVSVRTGAPVNAQEA